MLWRSSWCLAFQMSSFLNVLTCVCSLDFMVVVDWPVESARMIKAIDIRFCSGSTTLLSVSWLLTYSSVLLNGLSSQNLILCPWHHSRTTVWGKKSTGRSVQDGSDLRSAGQKWNNQIKNQQLWDDSSCFGKEKHTLGGLKRKESMHAWIYR